MLNLESSNLLWFRRRISWLLVFFISTLSFNSTFTFILISVQAFKNVINHNYLRFQLTWVDINCRFQCSCLTASLSQSIWAFIFYCLHTRRSLSTWSLTCQRWLDNIWNYSNVFVRIRLIRIINYADLCFSFRYQTFLLLYLYNVQILSL